MAELATAKIADEQIHEARKHIKKARAVILLLRTSMRTPRARTRLRHAARLLSPMRDAQALIKATDELCGTKRRLPAGTCAAIHRHLKKRGTIVRRSADRHKAVQRSRGALGEVRRSLSSWDWSDVGRRHVDAAIQQSYREARRAMKRAEKSVDPTELHTFRKRVKALWYGLRLLGRHPPALHSEVLQLERIEELLGEAHNLFVLQTKTLASLDRDQSASLAKHVEQRRAQLRRRALAQSRRIFAARPKHFGARLRTLRTHDTSGDGQ